MAQVVKYSEDNFEYKEGPFVVCDCGGKYRIEVELKGHHTSVLPHVSIYEIRELYENKPGLMKLEEAIHICDILNLLVLEGEIIYDGVWKAK